MQRNNASLQNKILSWLMPLMLLLILVDSSLLNRLAINALEKELDADLRSSSQDITSYLKQSGIDATDFELLENASRILLNDNVDRILYSVSNENGALLSGNKNLFEKTKTITYTSTNTNIKTKAKTSNLDAYYFFADIDNEKFRVIRSTFKVMNSFGPHDINIQVAVTLNRRNALANKILVGIVVPQLLLVVVSLLIISMSVKRGLAPLGELQNAVSKRSEKNLSPINLPNIPEEVSLVANSVNQLMRQLQNLISGQNQFIADAAHQLRTPLAGAQAQLELAELESDPAKLKSILLKVHQSLDRLLHTINQLLVLAKSQPEAVSMIKMEALDLNIISKEVALEMAPTAIQKKIDLGFEEATTPAMILGNTERLKELLYNLLDNAIRYTQNAGCVTLSINVTDEDVELIVADNGPGISMADRDKIFDRFHRVIGSGQDGSGLGLAIVKEIANLHNADIVVSEANSTNGLQVTVSFSKWMES
jgi:two-component system sensor histidine kinase TctE